MGAMPTYIPRDAAGTEDRKVAGRVRHAGRSSTGDAGARKAAQK